ncbi:hypothetical protein N431DRAFT_428324, partial [Stipitochalara longipes BDJ]
MISELDLNQSRPELLSSPAIIRDHKRNQEQTHLPNRHNYNRRNSPKPRKMCVEQDVLCCQCKEAMTTV